MFCDIFCQRFSQSCEANWQFVVECNIMLLGNRCRLQVRIGRRRSSQAQNPALALTFIVYLTCGLGQHSTRVRMRSEIED